MASAAVNFANGNIFAISERDEKTKLLAAVLFPLLLDKSNGNSSVNNSFTENSSECSSTDDSPENMYDSAQIITESVIFCYIFMRNPHLKVSRLYFSKHQISKKTVFRFLKNYCCNISKRSPSVHFAVLHSLTFAYHAIEFCTDKGHGEFQSFIPFWWEYIFNKTFKEEFYNQGDWEDFIEYVNDDFYIDITQTEFRTRWNLSSATLGCDFSSLELSNDDDIPISDESSNGSEESEKPFRNNMQEKLYPCKTGNKPQNSLCNPCEASETRGTCNALPIRSSEELYDSCMINKEKNEFSNTNVMFNPNSMKESGEFRNVIVSETRGAVSSPRTLNHTQEFIRNHAVNESQLLSGIPTSVIRSGSMFPYQTAMIEQQQKYQAAVIEHQKFFHNSNAVQLTKNGTQQSIDFSSTMREMPQTPSDPISVINKQEVFNYQSTIDEEQRALHSATELTMTQQALQSTTGLTMTQQALQSTTEMNTMQQTLQSTTALNIMQQALQSTTELTMTQQALQSTTELTMTQQALQSTTELTMTQQALQSTTGLTTMQQTLQSTTELNIMQQALQSTTELITMKQTLQNQISLNKGQEIFYIPILLDEISSPERSPDQENL